MWNSPPCRKPAVTRRHHSPWANPMFHLAPKETSVRMSRFMTASGLPPRMLKIVVAMYSPKLSRRIMVVLKRKWGINPPTSWEESSRETWRGATASLQYGQTRSLMVINARQCGHMRRGSISTIIRCSGADPQVRAGTPGPALLPALGRPTGAWAADRGVRPTNRASARSLVQSIIPAMVKTEREYRDDICQIGRLAFQKGWVAANDGNITIRLDADRILATPTGVCKG